MKCDRNSMLLYAVTDRAWVGKQTLMQQVESAIKGGATCVQLREKELDEDAFLKEAIEMKGSLAVIDAGKCVNCGLCVSKCPVKAIADARPPRPAPAPTPAAQ